MILFLTTYTEILNNSFPENLYQSSKEINNTTQSAKL